MSEITLRPLYPEDIDQVSRIEGSLTGSSRRALLEKRLVAATADPGAMFLHENGDLPLGLQAMPESFVTCAALDGKKIVGYGFARILEGEFGARSAIGEIDDIGVDPAYQGRGIGKLVIAGIEQRMAKSNIGTLRTQVIWSSLQMVRFFSSTEFTPASGQIIERSTAPLADEVAEAAEKRVTVRPLKWEDLPGVDRIDAKLTGLDRSAYCAAKFRQTLDESGDRFSLVAEEDGIVAGFIMARADFGEFGSVEKTAVIDTIGVHPAYGGSGIGQALLSQLLINLSALQVESVRTKVEHQDSGLWNFLTRRGFKPSKRLLLTKEIL